MHGLSFYDNICEICLVLENIVLLENYDLTKLLYDHQHLKLLMHCYIELYPVDGVATGHIYMTTSNLYMMKLLHCL